MPSAKVQHATVWKYEASLSQVTCRTELFLCNRKDISRFSNTFIVYILGISPIIHNMLAILEMIPHRPSNQITYVFAAIQGLSVHCTTYLPFPIIRILVYWNEILGISAPKYHL